MPQRVLLSINKAGIVDIIVVLVIFQARFLSFPAFHPRDFQASLVSRLPKADKQNFHSGENFNRVQLFPEWCLLVYTEVED